MRTQTYALLLLTLFTCTHILGCRRPPMVMPALFAQGHVDALDQDTDPDHPNRIKLFYATDRQFKTSDDGSVRYNFKRDGKLNLGQATLTFGPDDAWPSIVAATRNQPEGKRYSPRLTELTRYGHVEFGSIIHDDPGGTKTKSGLGETADQFIDELNQAITTGPGKSITIYIHGYKQSFTKAALTTAEYDLYTGGLGPFILYSWPSYDSLWEYSHDRDSVRFTTANARRFFAFLADEINAGRLHADKINVIAHSTGAEVIGTVLRELALLSHHIPAEQRAARWHIGSVLLVAPDISTDVARERLLKEDLRGLYQQIVVYNSGRDRALAWASRILYRTPRIGSVREDELTDADKHWIGSAPGVAVIDIESQPYRGLVNHSHHRFSPAVASDIILCLRSDLPPQERGLIREEGKLFWQFADNYPQLIAEAATKVYKKSTPESPATQP